MGLFQALDKELKNRKWFADSRLELAKELLYGEPSKPSAAMLYAWQAIHASRREHRPEVEREALALLEKIPLQ